MTAGAGTTSDAAPTTALLAAAGRSPDRIHFIDNARAIGIVLVVIGHAPGFPARLIDFIFAFHMPLFFLLSGLLVDAGRSTMSTAHRVRSLARSLLVPYAFYFVVAYAYWLVAKRHGLRAAEMQALPWWDPIAGLVRGNGDGLYVDVVLWFFPCLFVTAVVHHLLRKAMPNGVVAVLLTLAAGLFVAWHDPAGARWIWSADCAVVASAFYAWGTLLHRHARHELVHDRAALRIGLAVAAGAGCFALSMVTGHVDLNGLDFGAAPALYLPTAVVGIAAMLAVASTIPPSRLARWLSTNTLTIFPLHFLFFSVLTGIALVVFRLDPSFKDSVWCGLVYTVLALAACRPAERAMRAVFPWVLGVRGRHRSSMSSDDRAVGIDSSRMPS